MCIEVKDKCNFPLYALYLNDEEFVFVYNLICERAKTEKDDPGNGIAADIFEKLRCLQSYIVAKDNLLDAEKIYQYSLQIERG